MRAFVTGGSGFIGGQVVRKLIARGYEVAALVRSGTHAGLEAAGAQIVKGDIGDVESLRAGMQGSDVVYHLAGWYKMGAKNPKEGTIINIDGTRNVLDVAYALGIPRIVYTSTVAIFSNTKGKVMDETARFSGPFLTEYDRTKWVAHHQVAGPLIKKGAPIIIVMPGGVYGPGDSSLVGDLMRRFYKGQLPVVPGPETALTWAYVDDVAEGHILAGEKGKIGESYILAGPILTMGEAVRLWAEVTGKRAPAIKVPARLLRPTAPLMGLASAVLPLPAMFSREATASLGATYLGRADKARQELGWEARAPRQGFAETFAWIAEQDR